MSTPHRAGHASRPPANPQRRPASAGRGGPQPNPLAAMSRLGIGSFIGGLIAVIVAVIIHDHAAYPNMICNTGLGELGQAFSNTAQVDCGVATTAESAVGWLVAAGVLGLVIGLGKMGLALAGANHAPVRPERPKQSPAAAAPAANAAGAAGQAAAPAPYGNAAPVVASAAQPPTGPAMPERPAAWAPPPPPPGQVGPRWWE